MRASLSPADRIEELSRHLEIVASRAQEAEDNGDELLFESLWGSIQFKPSEVTVALSSIDPMEDHSDRAAASLLAQTAALCLKVSEEARDYRTGAKLDPELEQKISERLRRDISVAKSLVNDLGMVIEQALKDGDREQAVRLGEFRLAVRQQVSGLRRTLDGVEPGSDDDADGEAGIKSVADLEVDEQAVEADERFEMSRKRYAKMKLKWAIEEREREKWRRLRVMLMIVGVGLATAVISMGIQLLPVFNLQTTPVLKMSDFEHIPAISSVEAHPPSVFVKVHGVQWRQLDAKRRLETVRQVGRILNKAGYNGTRIRTEDGTLVGEWIREVGTYVYPKNRP